jgi:1,4-dihydroxy-2-naphthoate octaprenyltransferase
MRLRAWWHRHTLRTKILLGLAALASAGTLVILGFLVNLFAAGYSGGNNPQSVAPLAFVVAFIGFVAVGVPAILVTAGLWVGFVRSATRTRSRGDPSDRQAAEGG